MGILYKNFFNEALKSFRIKTNADSVELQPEIIQPPVGLCGAKSWIATIYDLIRQPF